MSKEINLKERTNCPSCHVERLNTNKVLHAKEEWSLIQCEQCSFVYMPIVPAYEMMKKDFSWERNFNSSEKVSMLKKNRRFIKALIKRNKLLYLLGKYCLKGNVLDIGCGSGIKFNDIPERYIPYGIDISEGSAREADISFRKRGGEAICAPATEVVSKFGNNKFSAAILRSYLEHEHQPFEVLKALKETLVLNGVIIIKVPNYSSLNRKFRGDNWCGFRYPDHVNQFTPKTLSEMVESTGYQIIKFNFLDKQPTSDNMWMVAKTNI
tara:strand:+ start:359 stop:1159 length:801 start_codon:yes stop_codon:yes gene_type:complete